MVTLQRAAGRRARGQRHAAGRRARRVRAAERARQRAPGDRAASRAAVAALGLEPAPRRAAEDGRGRGHDERDGARQRVPRRPAGRRSACVARAATACASRSPTCGGARRAPGAEAPDLEAKLAGLQTPRGWGLFLIEKMVDEARVTGDERPAHVELVAAPGRRRTMATRELEATVRRARRPSPVIDLRGDVDAPRRGGARRAPRRRRATPAPDAVVLNFSDADYINSTGIALIVGLLAQARARAGSRCSACGLSRPLPRDLRDHPAGGLHDDHRRRGPRRDGRGREHR